MAAEAHVDGVNLFAAARLNAFDEGTHGSCEHNLLKRDLVEHVNNLN